MLIVFLILVFCLVTHFKSTVIAYSPFKFLFTNGVILIGNISFDNAISFLVVIIFAFQYFVKKEYHYQKGRWPLMLSFLIMILSESISALIGDSNIMSIPLKFCRTYGYCLVLYYLIKDEADFKLLVKSLFLFSIILIGNAVVQFLFDINIIGNWVASSLKDGVFFADTTDYGSRGVRIQSFMAHSICFGDVCAIFIMVIAYLYKQGYMKRLCEIVIFLLGLVMANSRTPLMALLIYIIPFADKEKIIKYRFWYGLGLIAFVLVFASPLYQMYDSMFNDNTDFDLGGSDMTMRLEQLEASIYVVQNSLIWGLGYSFDFSNITELRGAESIWFNLLMYQGLVGCLCYVFIIIQSITKTRHYSCYRYIFYMSIGYFIQQTSTYNAGITEFLFYYCLIILIAHSDIFSNGQKELTTEEGEIAFI